MTPVVLHGDVLDVLPTLADGSVDAVVTDPPYALGFMGHAWDTHTPAGFQAWCQAWAAECLRVLKPGGHLLAFGGTRTVHRLTSGIEDAGFEIRDGIDWLYGSGFPKSLDVSKAIDKRPGVARHTDFAAHLTQRRQAMGLSRADVSERVVGTRSGACWNWEHHQFPEARWWAALRNLLELDESTWGPVIAEAERERIGTRPGNRLAVAPGQGSDRSAVDLNVTAPATNLARQWSGWGTALKPAREPIVVARKPLDGTVAANVVRHGTGALNIDACRTPGPPSVGGNAPGVVMGSFQGSGWKKAPQAIDRNVTAGRWPTNVVLSHTGNNTDGDLCADGCVPGCPVAELDEQSGIHKAGERPANRQGIGDGYGLRPPRTGTTGEREKLDAGGASRFYPVFRYQAKAPARERPKVDGVAHPTVKPLALLRWLVQLVTPPGGHVLDPFAGSGTTVEACLLDGYQVTAVENHAPYLPLIDARITRATGTTTH